ncbi:hypothetical protein [Streptomyces hokutonensis]|uniref:hypothetical protein n=1 Tax=Streptomyces hokutonensis TaxID=1306990 RepID=UPI000366A038|nr:hypothetical protein [Streptomyces hokutonensis]
MKLPFVRRTTADALRDKLARAEEEVVAQAASVAAKDGEVQRLTDELNDARLAREAAQEAYEIANSRAARAEERVTELEARPWWFRKQPDTDGPGPEDRDYAFKVLNCAFPQFADIVAQNGGVLPDENYKALSIYVNGASMYYGLSDAEVEEVGVRHGIPAPILQKAKDFVSRALPAGAV